MHLLDDKALERSGVVANCQMNRERTLIGSNGYVRELGFNPLDCLREQVASIGKCSWLDLCCGSGTALINAACIAESEGISDRIEIVGVDLVGGGVSNASCLRLVEASLATWQPHRNFDLITCVHGMHYIGDKFGLLARAASWLEEHGRFIANLDLANVRVQNYSNSKRIVLKELRSAAFEYNSRKRLVSCNGRKNVRFPFHYLGADDQAGPNYTRQASVNSMYETEGGKSTV